MKFYLASPFFNEKEIKTLDKIEAVLTEKGIDFWSPRSYPLEGMETGTREWAMATYMHDIKALDFCDATIMVCHGNYSDSGTSFEAGYTIGRGKPLIVVHIGEDANIMVHTPAIANLTLDELFDYNFDKLENKFYSGKML